ncbi:MAG: hypothetical protein EOO50_12300 [Flavobacterium sp.]|uniref:hypothetical protein n=1 Tax=Flavobacterium sp. TaxID=239 RepID=UPI001209E1D8|nr:hypothetical protein [Flavobacterium sp.]RZJ65790.1 MAG: hypothetical protein EOO50_12300 [Flavobacterium sp.]
MVKTLTTLALFMFSFAIGQSKYEEGMQKGLQLWGEGKPVEATAMFERIAAAEKSQWLPNYYIALVNTVSAFQTQDKTQIAALLDKAQKALDKEYDKATDNSEIAVMQAMIYTAYVASDPMTNAMKYSAQIMDLYEKAQKLDPKNPRAVFGKAEFEIGGAKYFGSDTTPMCQEIQRSIKMFEDFKPESAFHPKWGQDRAMAALLECGKK